MVRMPAKVIAVAVVLLCGSTVAATPPVVCRSPDEKLAIEFSLREVERSSAVPHYRVRAGDAEVVGWSRLGVDLADGEFLGGPCEITAVETRWVRDQFAKSRARGREVVGHAPEATVGLREPPHRTRRWEVVLRAYDDGVAFRYRFPAQEGWEKLVLA